MNEKTHGRSSAFPGEGYEGMTIREHFASMAMQGLCTRDPFWDPAPMAVEAVNIADALIRALNKIEG